MSLKHILIHVGRQKFPNQEETFSNQLLSREETIGNKRKRVGANIQNPRDQPLLHVGYLYLNY